MKCPYCESETEQGTAFFTGIGFSVFSGACLSFLPEEEKNKSFFKKQTKNLYINPVEEPQANYCPSCKKIIIGFEVDSD